MLLDVAKTQRLADEVKLNLKAHPEPEHLLRQWRELLEDGDGTSQGMAVLQTVVSQWWVKKKRRTP